MASVSSHFLENILTRQTPISPICPSQSCTEFLGTATVLFFTRILGHLYDIETFLMCFMYIYKTTELVTLFKRNIKCAKLHFMI